MRLERALALRDSFKTRMADLCSMAITCGLPNAEIQASLSAMRADTPKGTPGWVWAYLDGYMAARRDEFYRDHLIFGGFFDGVFYSTHSNREDYYGKHGIDPADYADDGRVQNRGHYWPRVVPYRGGFHDRGAYKPFFINE
jgi:hypothetical protein